MSFEQILFYAIQFAVLLLALSIHEAAHAFASNRLGDPTARQLGRLTLNPAKHIDPVGTLALPLLAILMSFPVIGWAKPVPVNTHNLSDPKVDHAFIALAGPVSNVAQAVAFTIILWMIEPLNLLSNTGAGYASFFLYIFLLAGIVINLILAVFNMIPIPPLDGGWILGGVLPDEFSHLLLSIGQFGFIIIWFLLYLGVFKYIFAPIIGAFIGAFLPETAAMVSGQIFGF